MNYLGILLGISGIVVIANAGRTCLDSKPLSSPDKLAGTWHYVQGCETLRSGQSRKCSEIHIVHNAGKYLIEGIPVDSHFRWRFSNWTYAILKTDYKNYAVEIGCPDDNAEKVVYGAIWSRSKPYLDSKSASSARGSLRNIGFVCNIMDWVDCGRKRVLPNGIYDRMKRNFDMFGDIFQKFGPNNMGSVMSMARGMGATSASYGSVGPFPPAENNERGTQQTAVSSMSTSNARVGQDAPGSIAGGFPNFMPFGNLFPALGQQLPATNATTSPSSSHNQNISSAADATVTNTVDTRHYTLNGSTKFGYKHNAADSSTDLQYSHGVPGNSSIVDYAQKASGNSTLVGYERITPGNVTQLRYDQQGSKNATNLVLGRIAPEVGGSSVLAIRKEDHKNDTTLGYTQKTLGNTTNLAFQHKESDNTTYVGYIDDKPGSGTGTAHAGNAQNTPSNTTHHVETQHVSNDKSGSGTTTTHVENTQNTPSNTTHHVETHDTEKSGSGTGTTHTGNTQNTLGNTTHHVETHSTDKSGSGTSTTHIGNAQNGLGNTTQHVETHDTDKSGSGASTTHVGNDQNTLSNTTHHVVSKYVTSVQSGNQQHTGNSTHPGYQHIPQPSSPQDPKLLSLGYSHYASEKLIHMGEPQNASENATHLGYSYYTSGNSTNKTHQTDARSRVDDVLRPPPLPVHQSGHENGTAEETHAASAVASNNGATVSSNSSESTATREHAAKTEGGEHKTLTEGKTEGGEHKTLTEGKTEEKSITVDSGLQTHTNANDTVGNTGSAGETTPIPTTAAPQTEGGARKNDVQPVSDTNDTTGHPQKSKGRNRLRSETDEDSEDDVSANNTHVSSVSDGSKVETDHSNKAGESKVIITNLSTNETVERRLDNTEEAVDRSSDNKHVNSKEKQTLVEVTQSDTRHNATDAAVHQVANDFSSNNQQATQLQGSSSQENHKNETKVVRENNENTSTLIKQTESENVTSTSTVTKFKSSSGIWNSSSIFEKSSRMLSGALQGLRQGGRRGNLAVGNGTDDEHLVINMNGQITEFRNSSSGNSETAKELTRTKEILGEKLGNFKSTLQTEKYADEKAESGKHEQQNNETAREETKTHTDDVKSERAGIDTVHSVVLGDAATSMSADDGKTPSLGCGGVSLPNSAVDKDHTDAENKAKPAEVPDDHKTTERPDKISDAVEKVSGKTDTTPHVSLGAAFNSEQLKFKS